MSQHDKLQAQLPTIVSGVLQCYSDMLGKHNEEELKGLFAENAKLTIDKRVLGPKDIAAHLIKLNCEFKAEDYTAMLNDRNEAIVTGFCLWGNERRPFTMVLNITCSQDASASGDIKITNHMILAK